jgi:hypothetical protein
MADISSLINESHHKWSKAHDILMRASCGHAEPVPPLTGAEIEDLISFSNAYRNLLIEIGVLPRSVSKLDLNRLAKEA